MMTTDFPRNLPSASGQRSIGDNTAAFTLAERLQADYAELQHRVELMAAMANRLPKQIGNDRDQATVAEAIKEIRGTGKDIDTKRKAETAELRAATKTINDFFGAMVDRVENMVSVLSKRISSYLDMKLEVEREEAKIAAEQARIAAEAKRVALETQPEFTNTIEDKLAASAAEHDARMAEKLAAGAGQDLVRSHTEGGTMVSYETRWTVIIDDMSAVPADSIWPFVSEADRVKAINAYCRANSRGGKTPSQLPGVRFVAETKAIVR